MKKVEGTIENFSFVFNLCTIFNLLKSKVAQFDKVNTDFFLSLNILKGTQRLYVIIINIRANEIIRSS